MNIQEKLARSKINPNINIGRIKCQKEDEDLVKIIPTSKLKVIPIWVEEVDPFEGKLYQEYINKNPKYQTLYCRESVYRKLLTASESLPDNLQLIVRAGHRPLEVQKKLLQSLIDNYIKNNPEDSTDSALEFARTFVSDPRIDLPPHCCGAAVDIDLYDKTKHKLVDFGCSVNTDSPISFLHSNDITKEQKDNRILLLKSMLNAGFASLQSEWWHYSYGDQQWAWFYNKPQSIFGITDPKL